MTSNRMVGIINIVLGLTQIITVFLFPIFVIPQLIEIYSTFGIIDQLNYTLIYGPLGIIVFMGIINLVLGIINFVQKKVNQKYFKYGLVVAIGSFLTMGILLSISGMNIVSSMYDLTTKF